ncbi:unnamed protein product [Toxocara canis]|uniref:BPTI/Kunitz inhibitor domain-containing protein n=1 Tax=Toxocara canis TaxID=6265 RepID=A0A183V878_TOXCA|nr:unnamed protein product [Toxocara canis]
MSQAAKEDDKKSNKGGKAGSRSMKVMSIDDYVVLPDVPATPQTGKTPATTSPGAGTPETRGSVPATPEKSSGSKRTAQKTPSSGTPNRRTPDAGSAGVGSIKSAGEDRNENLADEVAPNEKMEEESLPEPDIVNKEVGEDTDRLSDMSDDEGPFGTHSRTSLSSSRLMSWLGRISPLIRNRKVRYLAVVNFFLSTFNIILMLVLVALLIHFVVLTVKKNEAIGRVENPCIFRYGNWGKCSAQCWNKANGDPMPTMKRQVIPSSIIQARGNKYKQCPEDLAERYEEAPCNFFKCPQDLSKFGFGKQCYYHDANKGKQGGCYRIRMLPIDDYTLIRIDAELTQNCTECPDFLI